MDVALLVELGGHRAAVFLRQGHVALQLDRHRHGHLAQADAAGHDAGERAGLAVIVEQFEDQTVLAGAAAEFQTQGPGGGRPHDGNLGAFHRASRGYR